jgi:hypothetical protein
MARLKLALFGFVFGACAEAFIFIIPYENNSYVRFWQIGFVLHNLLFLIDPPSPRLWRAGPYFAKVSVLASNFSLGLLTNRSFG